MATAESLKLALITSGIDYLTVHFHEFPETPTAILEMGDWDLKQRLRYALRRCARLVSKNKYPDCEQYCKKHGLQYFRVKRSNKQAIKTHLQSCNASLAITFKCPLIPMDTLDHLPHGAINIHNALLPDYRGGNPLFWQVINNEDEMGSTVHKVSAQMDGGDVIEQQRFKRPRFVHHKDLDYLANVTHGVPMLKRAVTAIAAGNVKSQKQTEREGLNPAPNCDWQTWRDISTERSFSDEQIRDVACFVGETGSATVSPVKI